MASIIKVFRGVEINEEEIVAKIGQEAGRDVLEQLIQDAKAQNKYYFLSRNEKVVRTAIVMKNGMVFGTSVLVQTLERRTTETAAAKPTKKRKSRVTREGELYPSPIK